MNKIQEFWYKLSIRTKLMMFFSVIIVCISLLNLYISSNAFKYMDIYAEELKKTSGIYNLENLIYVCRSSFENNLANPEDETLKTFTDSIPEVWSGWNAVLEYSSGNQDALFEISAIRYGFIAYIETTQSVLIYREQSEEQFVKYLLKSRRIGSYIDTYLKELIRIHLGEGSRIHAIQLKRVNTIRLVSFLGVGLIAILLLFFGTLFSESVSRPIRLLASRSSKMAEGELSVEKISIPYKDEIGVLTNSFNRMSRKIHEMVQILEDKVEIEKRLREDEVKIAEMNHSLHEAQFLSLQSQINPHFLFNTLNTISRTSMFEKAPETVKLIESLSNVFRYTLNKHSLIVSLAEEVRILEEYMYIQQSRYGERLKFITEFSFPLEDVKIPIFTLQPLVENAIQHGIEAMEEGGTITLKVVSEDGKIIITLKDTGKGIPGDILEEMMNTEKSPGSMESAGIGISNVKRRLNLAFENMEIFEIISKAGEGTTITIIIPENKTCIEY